MRGNPKPCRPPRLLSLTADGCGRRCGKKLLIVLATLGQGVGFAAFGFVDDFSVVMGLSGAIGLWAGLGAGAQNALMADSLANIEDAGRDMNILMTAFTISQIVVPPACGYLLDAFSSGGGAAADLAVSGSGSGGADLTPDSDALAYRVIWPASGVLMVLSLPLLCWIHAAADEEQAEKSAGLTQRLASRNRQEGGEQYR